MRWRRRVGVAEAAVLLTMAKVAVRFVPFPTLRRILGSRADEVESTTTLPEPARECRRCVTAAARRLPFEVACLPQAIAGQAILRRRGLEGTVVFGLAKDGGELLNHAWLEHQGTIVLGEQPGVAFTRTISYRGSARKRFVRR